MKAYCRVDSRQRQVSDYAFKSSSALEQRCGRGRQNAGRKHHRAFDAPRTGLPRTIESRDIGKALRDLARACRAVRLARSAAEEEARCAGKSRTPEPSGALAWMFAYRLRYRAPQTSAGCSSSAARTIAAGDSLPAVETLSVLTATIADPGTETSESAA